MFALININLGWDESFILLVTRIYGQQLPKLKHTFPLKTTKHSVNSVIRIFFIKFVVYFLRNLTITL